MGNSPRRASLPAMVAPEERNLIIAFVLLLLLGGIVRSCRHRVTVEEFPPEKLPSIEAVDTSAD